MWLMLQRKKPDDFVIATGETHSVREFVEYAFELAGLNWKRHVRIDPRYFRPTEVETLLGDPTKARTNLGWQPRITFEQLVQEMVAEDYKAAQRDALVKRHGFAAYDYHE
jgi:GDPmannose 4,6-dehydratase